MTPLNWGQNTDPGDPNALNERVVLAVALATAVSVFLASHMPPPLFAPVLGELLFWSAFGSAVVARMHGQSILSDQLTYWDQALILLWLAMLTGFFTDMEAARGALDQLNGTAGTATTDIGPEA